MSDEPQAQERDFIDLAASVVSAYVTRNNVPVAELPGLIASVHAALSGLGEPVAAPVENYKVTPAQIRKSVTPDALISFLDGRPYKSLKRHLGSNGLTPDEYRQKYGLPRDYPMVAAAYAAQRSELARSLGLGQIRHDRAAARKAETKAEPAAAPTRRGRPKKVAAAGE